MSHMSFFEPLFMTLDSTLLQFVNQSVANLATYVNGAIRVFSVVTLIVVGIQALRGTAPVTRYFETLLMIVLVSNIAGNAGAYNEYLGSHLRGLPDDFLIALAPTDAESGKTYTDTSSVGAYLDGVVGPIMDGIAKIWHTGGLRDIPPLIIGGILSVLLFFLGAAIVVSITYAKVGVSIMVAIGPIMVLTVINKTTRDFFFKWLSYTLHFAVLQLLIGCVILVAQTVLSTYLVALSDTTASAPGNDLTAMMAPAIIMIVLAKIFEQLPSMASSIMGGIGISSGNVAVTGPKAAAQFGMAAGQVAGQLIGMATKKAIKSMRHPWEGSVSNGSDDEPVRPHTPGSKS